MSDAFPLVVLDDELSELRAEKFEKLKETLPALLLEALADVKVRPGELETIVEKVVEVAALTIDTDIERLHLCLQGRAPIH